MNLRRESDMATLSLRLDRPSRRRAPKGALKPDVAAALVRAAPVGPDDIVIDPFVGSGAILVERASYKSRSLVGSDADSAGVEGLKRYLHNRKLASAVQVFACDIRDVVPKVFPAHGATHVITDLPWGKYDHFDNLAGLYADAAESFARVLQPQGWLTCLTHVDAPITNDLLRCGFEVKSETNVLISGKKALVVVGRSGRTDIA